MKLPKIGTLAYEAYKLISMILMLGVPFAVANQEAISGMLVGYGYDPQQVALLFSFLVYASQRAIKFQKNVGK